MNKTKVLATGLGVCFLALTAIGCAKKESSPRPGAATPVVAHSPSAETAAVDEPKRGQPPASSASKPDPAAKPEPLVCSAEPDWRHERIPFPPQFAPSLGSGSEDLFFAEGMFDAKTPSYWSYVFSIRLDETVPTDKPGIETFFVDYYAGLISAVAKGKSLAFDPSTVKVRLTDKKLDLANVALEIDLIDAFTDGSKLTVKLVAAINTKDKCLNVVASPADSDKPIWKRLKAARSCVPCPSP